jgi:beta-glucanase (GH16 family)
MMPIRGRRSPERRALVLAVALMLLLASACTQAAADRGTPVFADEFDGTALGTQWQTQMVWGQLTDGQLERYDPSALGLRDGELALTAREQHGGEVPYVSGAITTFDRFEFTYGYAEIRARMPAGRGLWPAFWLAAVNPQSSSEIDVVEFLGHEPDTMHMTLHYDDAQGEHQEPQQTFRGPDFTADFHTFAVEWSPEAVVWYVDGVERARQTEGVPDEPMYLIANLAVGGPWAGAPSGETVFPAEYRIDWIRVYERPSANGPAQPSSAH